MHVCIYKSLFLPRIMKLYLNRNFKLCINKSIVTYDGLKLKNFNKQLHDLTSVEHAHLVRVSVSFCLFYKYICVCVCKQTSACNAHLKIMICKLVLGLLL